MVTSSDTGLPIAGATITLEAGGSVITTMVTDANGEYSNNKVPIGQYTIETTALNYIDDVKENVLLLKGRRTVDVSLMPQAGVVVSASVSGAAVPGASLTAEGSYTILDGSTYMSSGWSQGAEGLAATIGAGDNTTVDLADADAYAAFQIETLKEPPLSAADLPPNTVLQPGIEGAKGLQDRDQVVAINPMALEEGEALPLIYTVETTSGTYSKTVSVTVALPWHVSTGVRTVPVGTTVLLYAKDDTGYSWNINSAPVGSTAALTSATTQTPWFTPDVVGTYEIEETVSGAIIEVHAGRYHGVIDPLLTLNSVLYGDGRPVGDQNCTGCHMVGGAAPPNFDTWRLTGHAEAFTQGITDPNIASHFGENCFACHAVGYNLDGQGPGEDPGGIDDTPNYTAFLNLLSDNNASGNYANAWVDMLTEMPDTARLSNIQCENCHGPQDYTEAHHTPDSTPDGTPRVSLAADVCGSCHGEPARHGRFQQWLLSNHADYDLARERGAGGFAPGNCGRCHSGNGFVAWSKLPSPFDPDTNVTVTWDEDTVVPQTCPACHNPHDTGTTSGDAGTDARVRVNGKGGTCGGPDCDTYMLLAGFKASSVGKGATCMTCHNSRAGVPRNDATWASLTDSQKTGGPHHGVQADLIMGQNQYFTGGVPIPGKHYSIPDVCVTCHMNETPPPELLSYNLTGTNHTFAADPGICVNCHGAVGETLAESVDTEITGYMEELVDALGPAYMRVMEDHYPVAAGDGCNPADGTAGHEIDTVTWNYGGHSGPTLDITVTDGSFCTGRSLSSIQVDGGASSLEDALLNPANGAEDLLKARWNYGLNYEDETIIGCEDNTDPNCDPPHTHRGVHNHAFSQQGLLGAIAAVQAVAP